MLERGRLMSSYTCSSCGEIVATSRQAQHEEFWCSSIPDDVEVEAHQPNQHGLANTLQDLNQSLHKITNIELSSGLKLSFEEISVWSSGTSTGGALWKSELLLAEWVIRRSLSPSDIVLELGCGACPAAGMTASAMGCTAIMSDVANVVSLAETNLKRNALNVTKARNSQINRNNYDTLIFDWGSDKIPARLSSLSTPISVILIGDCIFNDSTHVILLKTITQLNATFVSAKIILAFQRRGTVEADFFALAKEEYDFQTAAVEDVEGLITKLDSNTSAHLGLEICELIKV